jgi:hypothetical protein
VSSTPEGHVYLYAMVPAETSLPGAPALRDPNRESADRDLKHHDLNRPDVTHLEPDHGPTVTAVADPDSAVPADVRLIRVGDLAVVVGDADLDALNAVNDPESDPSVLAGLAHRHDAVVRALMSVATSVIPFRLATVVTDETAVRSFATKHADEAARLLDRLAGAAEWGVRVGPVRADPAGGAAPATTTPRPTPAGSSRTTSAESSAERPGTAHLARRRAELADADRRRRARVATVARIREELRSMAVDASAGHGPGSALLEEAYLVRGPDTDRFLDTAERLGARLAGEGLRLRITGPWPPYSFARLPSHD